MKVKRIIKGFIYLFPVYFVLISALTFCLLSTQDNAIRVTKEVTSNGTTTYTYNNYAFESISVPVRIGIESFNAIMGSDFNSDLYTPVYELISYLGLNNDDDGTMYYFFGNVILYEIVAIMICAVLDVIFLIPEFYNKLEDKYIKGGRKRE